MFLKFIHNSQIFKQKLKKLRIISNWNGELKLSTNISLESISSADI